MRNKIIAIVAVVIGVLGITAGTAVGVSQITSADIRNGAVGTRDLNDDGIRSRDIRDGNVRKRDLTGWLQDQLGAPRASSVTGEDDVVNLTAGTRAEVASLAPGPGTHLVVAHATVSGGPDDNLLCWLVDEAGSDVAAGNARSARESFTLTALVTGPVSFQCRTTDANGTATDIAVTSVRVTE